MKAENFEVSNSEIIKDLIKEEQNSLAKEEMIKGVRYYLGYNDILKKDFREYYVRNAKYTDYNKANEHIVNNFHKKLVDQKKNYCSSKPVTITGSEELVDKVIEVLGRAEFDETISEVIKNASNKGFDTLQPYIDGEGEFGYSIIPSEQMIYIYDTSYEKTLVNAIRYFPMTWIDGDVERKSYRVEVWDFEKVTYYQEDSEGNYRFIYPGEMEDITINPMFHWYEYNTNNFDLITYEGMEAHSWGRVPFVKIKNNAEQRSDLMLIKTYIDAVDMVSSGFINDLRDVQLAIWVLKGYEGEDLGEFMTNLMTFKTINLSTDDGASAEPKTMDIPKEAREAMLRWLEDKIYDIGQGVNESDLTGGSITNVAIKAMYSGLDMKANDMIINVRKALSEFMYFVVTYINNRDGSNYDYKEIDFTFNKSRIFNELETLTALKDLGIRISNKTLLENAPIISDVEKELERLAEEQEEAINSLGGGLGFGDE
jgi:SPP1 family phage portal protein